MLMRLLRVHMAYLCGVGALVAVYGGWLSAREAIAARTLIPVISCCRWPSIDNVSLEYRPNNLNSDGDVSSMRDCDH